MKYLFFIILFAVITGNAMAQSAGLIKGKVVNGETGAPVANASIFITNTSRGTVSNSQGEFELNDAPLGSYDLVISCIGFETRVYSYKAAQLPLRLQVQLKPKADELQAVVVEPFEKDGWEKWGKFFIDNFIGKNPNAANCKLKNYQVLRFRNLKKRNTLTVTATEPLIIENKALGYSIKYQLEGFSYGFSDHVLFFFGFTLFSNLNGKTPKTRQLKNREKSYYGSMMHFIRSLYNDRLVEDGFDISRTLKIGNPEKERVKKILMEHPAQGASKDSAGYYDRIMNQHDSLDKYQALTIDSLVSPLDALTRKLFFSGSINITFKKAKEDPAYLQYTHENRYPWYQRSVLSMLTSNALTIDAMGNYYMPQDVINYGYWSWSEKICTMLPLDYEIKK